jgi:hypothetical protein
MLKKNLLITLTVIFVASVTLLFADELRGKDIINSGPLETLQGTLQYNSPEWYLETENLTYQLHFGNREYLDSSGIKLRNRERINIEGVVLHDDVVVYTATVDGKTYRFRDRDGAPFWAGRGNQKERHECEECGKDHYGWKRGNRSRMYDRRRGNV